jgi:membrane protease YdiL (CAAX protease family)
MGARRRATAVLEVLGVYLAGGLVVNLLVRALALEPINPLTTFTADVTDAELIVATRQLFLLLTLQYAGWFLLAVPIGWWHRRSGAAAYGFTRGGHSWPALILAGLAATALATWPTLSIQFIDGLYDLGETVPWRQALFDTTWRRWEFWVFAAVLSFGFVAVVEEVFFRGYCQRRLAEDWGNGPAIVGVACLFTFAHSQYLIPNAYNAAMIVTLLAIAIGFGIVFAWTGSLVPSIVAHAIINTPLTPPWQAFVLAVLVMGAVIMARRGASVVKQVFSGAAVGRCAALGLIGAGYVIAAQRIDGLVFAAAAMVAIAVGLETLDRRRNRAQPISTTV